MDFEPFNTLKKEIEDDKNLFVVLDGGTGTEIERLGGEMDEKGWSCVAQLFIPDIVRQVHINYINAGAKIITANTYATNRNVTTPSGYGDRTVESITLAVKLAREACTMSKNPSQRVYVAGSLSTHPPALPKGSAGSDLAIYPPPEEEYANYLEAINALVENKVDFIFLEMMKNTEHGPLAIKAASTTNLPIFLGISTRILPDGRIVLFDSNVGDRQPFTKEIFDLFTSTAGKNLVGINIMHTNFTAMLPTLKLVREFGWTGLLGAYPDHGKFSSPHWLFEAVDAHDVQNYVKEWVDKCNVKIIGGCCGLGPDFIENIFFLSKKR